MIQFIKLSGKYNKWKNNNFLIVNVAYDTSAASYHAVAIVVNVMDIFMCNVSICVVGYGNDIYERFSID